MPQYRRTSETVDAVQWNRLGDLPLVVPYQRKEVSPEAPCARCHHKMVYHGWIQPPLAPGANPLHPVDPVSGEPVVPSVAPVVAYPQVFVKPGEPDRTANNAPEAEVAVVDGFTLRDPVKYVTATAEPAPASVSSTYPITYVKAGSEPRVVMTDKQRASAISDGYVPETVEFPVPVTAGDRYRVGRTLGDRGDLNGLVVCPGDWVITHLDGEREICKPDHFPHLFAKVNPNEQAPFTSKLAVAQ